MIDSKYTIPFLLILALWPQHPLKAIDFDLINAHVGDDIVNSAKNSMATKPVQNLPDSSIVPPDSTTITDSSKVLADTLRIRYSDDGLEADVVYKARDSIVYLVPSNQIILYGKAEIYYQQIELKAELITYNWKSGTLKAEGITDSSGNLIGKPYFKDGDEEYRARILTYNFKTKKGKIYELFTEQGDGYIQTDEAKKDEYDNLYANRALYTTCDLEHPHFYIAASPVKIKKDEVLVSGPGNLVIADVPTPLVFPFGIFPIKQGQRSGLIIPGFTSTERRGFGLEEGGYYIGINEYVDAAITGSIYANGSWRLGINNRFKKRYKYDGSLHVGMSKFIDGEEFFNERSISKDYSVGSSFRVDPKAWPNNSLSGSLNIVTSDYNKKNSTDLQSHLQNAYSSNISYSHIFKNGKYNFSANLRHSQNTKTKVVTLTLPDIVFGVNRIHPFKPRIKTGQAKWYETIGLSYSGNISNQLTTYDSLVFRKQTLHDFDFGIQHNIPVSASARIFKYVNVTPSFNYTERWYLKEINATYYPLLDDSTGNYVQYDTIDKFKAVRYFTPNLSFNTKLFGRLNFKKSKLKAIRHVVSPTVGLNWRPDFGNEKWGYYETIQQTPDGDSLTYARYPSQPFGSAPRGKLTSISFSVDNNIEMKVFSKKDTLTHERKIPLFNSLRASGSYNFAADSLNLSNIIVTGNTQILDKIRGSFNFTFNPYVRDTLGRSINRFEWDSNKRFGRLDRFSFDLGTSFRANQAANQKKEKQSYTEWYQMIDNPLQYIEARYVFNLQRLFNTTTQRDTFTITQSIDLNSRIDLTDKWSLSVEGSYDFVKNDLVYAALEIYRDLHCWEMKLRWIPIGIQKGYTFSINVKSTVLKDLKLEKKDNPVDNF